MTNSRARRALGLVALVVACGPLPGCVVWEIRDGIRESNYSVAEANRRVGEATAQVTLAREQVAQTSAQITRADVAIETANERIAAADAQMVTTQARIASTEARIESTEKQLTQVEHIVEQRVQQANKLIAEVQPDLERLHSIGGSLSHIDAHLRSVRKTLNSLSDQMPFFELDADPIDSVPPPAPATPPTADAPTGEPAPAEPAPAENAPPPPTGAEPAPSPDTPAAPSAAAKRELLLGTWLREHPSTGVALIILADGAYILDANGPLSERGTWKRDGESVTFTPTTLAPAPPPAPGQPAPQAQPRPPRTYKVLGRAVRILTLDGGDAGILVFSRP